MALDIEQQLHVITALLALIGAVEVYQTIFITVTGLSGGDFIAVSFLLVTVSIGVGLLAVAANQGIKVFTVSES